uniref:PGG domain-containing protein n=1 Tax=Oryza barthii TaxID=65489 RepID=A0A0D3HIZ2_9ORYZ
MTVERNTILHIAAEQGHSKLIQELYHRFIKDNSFLSHCNLALDTPLHCAARAGNVDTVNVLLRLSHEDCRENILGCQNASGDTALHLAARHGHGATVEALVAAGASACELNKAGVSCLYLAVMSRSVATVRAVITSSGDVSSVGPSSQNALHAAVFKSLEMVHLLLQWKPALASQVDCNGSTPLHFAASDGNHSVVSTILLAAPPTTVYMKDSDGLSALHVGARLGHTNVVKELIGVYPDVAELRDIRGETFLHAAMKEKQSSVVSLAIKNPMLRGLLNVQDGDGNTPLHLAVAAGALHVVEALLQKGKVQTDVLNDDGHTPLDLASKSTGLFTMISLVVALVAFRAQGLPQRQDHLKPWSGRDIAQGIEKTSDSLAVVAMLIATAAFAGGFNILGGYGNDGTANLKGRITFKFFMVLDAIAIAASVVAVILLVYGKASRSAGSSKSFTAALHCMWISLVSLILAFYSASRAMITSWVVYIMFLAIYMCLCTLTIRIQKWVDPVTRFHTFWRFVRCSHRADTVKRQYSLASASAPNFLFFSFVNTIAFAALAVIPIFEIRRLSGKP